MQRIRLSKDVLLEITDEIESINLNEIPSIHLYEYGVNNNKQIVLSDGEKESRESSYWAYNNVLLSPTPNFYLDDKVSPNFHSTHKINTLLGNPTLNPPIQFRKIRMLFTQGFSYSTVGDGVAMNTLNINAVRPSNNARIDLISFIDIFDNTKIVAIPEVMHDNQLYNSAIELRLIDLAYLYNSDNIDVIALKERLFGNDSIETLFIEHAGVKINEIVNHSEFGNVYKKFYDAKRSRTQFSPRFQNNEIVCNVSKLDDGTVTAQMEHERFSLQGYLENISKVKELYYTYKFDEYNSNNDLISSQTVRISNPISLFTKSQYKYSPQNDTTSIKVTVEGFIRQEDNTKILRENSIILLDMSKLRTTNISLTINEEKLVRTNINEVKQVVYKNETPKIINIDKPVFINVEKSLDTITLTPYKQTIKVNLNSDIDLSTVRQVKLVIGKTSYLNSTNGKTTFTVGGESYFSKEKKFYLLDIHDNVISYGSIERI